MSETTDKLVSVEDLPAFGVVDLAGVMPWISLEMDQQVSSHIKVLEESDPEYLEMSTIFFNWGNDRVDDLIAKVKLTQGLGARSTLPCSLVAVIGGEMHLAQYIPRLDGRYTRVSDGGVIMVNDIVALTLPWDETRARKAINFADTTARFRPSYVGVFPQHYLLLGERKKIPNTF